MAAEIRRRLVSSLLVLLAAAAAPHAARAESEAAKPPPPVIPLRPGESRTVTVNLRDYAMRGLSLPEATQRVAIFDEELARFGSRPTIASCRNVVVAPATIKGASDSFGGACTLRDGRFLLVCDDARSGHFATKPVEGEALPDVPLFVIQHCIGI